MDDLNLDTALLIYSRLDSSGLYSLSLVSRNLNRTLSKLSSLDSFWHLLLQAMGASVSAERASECRAIYQSIARHFEFTDDILQNELATRTLIEMAPWSLRLSAEDVIHRACCIGSRDVLRIFACNDPVLLSCAPESYQLPLATRIYLSTIGEMLEVGKAEDPCDIHRASLHACYHGHIRIAELILETGQLDDDDRHDMRLDALMFGHQELATLLQSQ